MSAASCGSRCSQLGRPPPGARRMTTPSRSSCIPLLAVWRPQPNRSSETRSLPSHNSIVTSAINKRRSRPFSRRAAERINWSSCDSNNMLAFRGHVRAWPRVGLPPRAAAHCINHGSLSQQVAMQEEQIAGNPRRVTMQQKGPKSGPPRKLPCSVHCRATRLSDKS